jgi:SAM-dependent methyltransferase/glycosyltransferase involved in cell wall biosynthesis
MSEKIKATGGRGLKILDYGCAHGHYIVPWAKALTSSDFLGVDISARAIAAAMEWTRTEGLGNVSFVIGAQDWLDTHPYGFFDIIFAGEVVEHVVDYRTLIEKFRRLLKADGLLVITTPYGRWEWTGHENSKIGREHLHFFERQDLKELFAGHDAAFTCAPAGTDECEFALGSWITAVTFKEGVPLGTVDMKRKLAQYPTRQTVSACYIVKDGERDLPKSLDSIAWYVDEILIGIDDTTTDHTQRAVEEFKLKNPWLTVETITIESPLVSGFDAARNSVIDRAAGDWVLWLDADEVVIGAERLHKYLRPSLANGVHFPQVHYSVQPAQVIATDHPCRLYRARSGIRIKGLVHEHPEKEGEHAVPQAVMRDDVQFAHAGYITEDVRRKRYSRNMPLLVKDLAANPDRTLNKFLMIRDLSQGIVFAAQAGKPLNGVHHQDAETVVKMYGELIENKLPVTRLLIDALNYYSACVEMLGCGFEAELNFRTIKPPLTGGTKIKGRFYNRDHFLKMSNRLFEEATSTYESKYF